MLKALTVNKASFVALLAKAARAQQDALLGRVAERDFGEISPAKGEHNPTAALGFEPLVAENAPQIVALSDALNTLSSTARSELYALMRIGQGQLTAKKWHRGLTEAQNLGDETVTDAILEDLDLHDHIMKGLYQTGLLR